jgi:hypothetical protein
MRGRAAAHGGELRRHAGHHAHLLGQGVAEGFGGLERTARGQLELDLELAAVLRRQELGLGLGQQRDAGEKHQRGDDHVTARWLSDQRSVAR